MDTGLSYHRNFLLSFLYAWSRMINLLSHCLSNNENYKYLLQRNITMYFSDDFYMARSCESFGVQGESTVQVALLYRIHRIRCVFVRARNAVNS